MGIISAFIKSLKVGHGFILHMHSQTFREGAGQRLDNSTPEAQNILYTLLPKACEEDDLQIIEHCDLVEGHMRKRENSFLNYMTKLYINYKIILPMAQFLRWYSRKSTG